MVESPKFYRLFWKSNTTGITGNGDLYFSYKEAKEITRDFNKKYPELHHWIQ
jgi:hypothetical protein